MHWPVVETVGGCPAIAVSALLLLRRAYCRGVFMRGFADVPTSRATVPGAAVLVCDGQFCGGSGVSGAGVSICSGTLDSGSVSFCGVV